jgi:small multidrug resistance pump
MGSLTTYVVLVIGVTFGVISNSAAKSADGFTILVPSIISAITIIICMYTISYVSKTIPIGITYASFAGLAIIATAIVGVIKFNQIPNLFTIIGLGLIITGVLMVNLLGK